MCCSVPEWHQTQAGHISLVWLFSRNVFWICIVFVLCSTLPCVVCLIVVWTMDFFRKYPGRGRPNSIIHEKDVLKIAFTFLHHQKKNFTVNKSRHRCNPFWSKNGHFISVWWTVLHEIHSGYCCIEGSRAWHERAAIYWERLPVEILARLWIIEWSCTWSNSSKWFSDITNYMVGRVSINCLVSGKSAA